MRRLPLYVLLGLAACKEAQTPPVVTPTQNPPAETKKADPPAPAPKAEAKKPEPPALRLGEDALPSRYKVNLWLDPTKDTFTGEVEISLNLAKKTSLIWLHGTEITIERGTLRANGKEQPITSFVANEDVLGIVPGAPVDAGTATLTLRYQGKISSEATEGIFREKENDRWYIFTQFESISARRAFPCLDEPAYKVPWDLTIHAPEGNLAVANTPQVGEATKGSNGLAYHFQETKPLPSYLLAFGVGPFEVVEGGKIGRNKIPFRIIVPQGKGPEAAYSVSVTDSILSGLEDYTNIPYPFEKLDFLAIPDTFGFGAMENPGLVTYASRVLLSKPSEENAGFHRRSSGTISHELAHMWFGDLVTPVYWDDIWLNESFASWLGDRTVLKLNPAWNLDPSWVRGKAGSAGIDTRVTARKIRNPIKTQADIERAFDGITYGKGKAVLAMFERYLGEDKFREGIRAYLQAHSYKNATASDFLGDMSAALKLDFTTPFSSFIDQGGVPLLTATLQCEKGAAPTLQLSQERYLPLGAKSEGPAQRWGIPICARYPVGKGSETSCTILDQAEGKLALDKAKGCPAWVLPNAGHSGYYITRYQGDLLQKLVKAGKALSESERLGVWSDAQFLVGHGDLSRGDLYGFIPSFLKEPSYYLLSSTAGAVDGLEQDYLSADALPGYRAFLEKHYGAKARALGLLPKPKDTPEDQLLRGSLVSMMGSSGEDKTLRAEAEKLARAWFKDHNSVPDDASGNALYLAALGGGRELFDLYASEAQRAPERSDRRTLYSLLGTFKDQALQQDALALVWKEELPIREVGQVVWSVAGNNPDLAYKFITDNYEKLAKRIPKDNLAGVARIGGYFCTEAKKAEIEAFFKDKLASLDGGSITLSQVLEGMSTCIAQRPAQRESASAFFRTQK